MKRNDRQLCDILAGTGIFPVLRGVMEYISSEQSDKQGRKAAKELYYTLTQLVYDTITIREALCRVRVPEIVARHCHVLHPQHTVDQV